MKISDDGSTITFRQSWLNTAFLCPERGRLDAITESDSTTDEAFIGTASHAGIEAVVNGASIAEGRAAVRDEYRINPEAEQIRFVKRGSIAECIDMSERCFDAWVRDIMPIAPLEGAKAEVAFSQPIMEYRGMLVVVEGTADLVPATGNVVWDWKTSNSEYNQKDKQKWATQPTMYGWVAALGAMGRTDFTLPIEFKYGVMVKRVKECRGQIVTVQRTANHVAWLEHRMKAMVDLYLDYGLDKPWPMVDEKNYLCSAKWCDFYDECRGKFITMDNDLFGWIRPAA